MSKPSAAGAPEGQLAQDTILAVSTPPGASAVCVLRMSGPYAAGAVMALDPAAGAAVERAPGFAELAVTLRLPGGVVRARAALFRAPRSYTGEDVVELTFPGAPPIANGIARELLRLSAGAAAPALRWARPGELTLRACVNGRVDLEQAEGIAALIAAAGEAEARAAQRSLHGELGARLRGLRERVLECLALIEAGLDFPDEGLQEVSPRALHARLRACGDDLAALRGICALRMPGAGTLRVVLWGLPNAGKSSLLNALVGRPIALASPVAGTTRDPVRGVTEHGGRRIEWMDLAGTLDPAAAALGGEPGGDDEVWRVVRRMTAIEVEHADVVLWVVDAGGDLKAAERGWERLGVARRLVVLQKSDLITAEVESRLPAAWTGAARTSALRGTGVPELVAQVLAAAAGPEARRDPAQVPQLLLSGRQAAGLELVEASLARAAAALAADPSPECAASDLRDAVQALDELAGSSGREAVLDLVFSRFCIGK